MAEEPKRTLLTSLRGTKIVDIVDGPCNSIYFVGTDGKAFALVDRADLFDSEGNYFEDDL